MTYFKTSALNSKFAALMLGAWASLLVSCVKPANHESKIDGGASFFVDKIADPAVDTTTVPGFSIPAQRIYTFTACLKDRRTEEALPSAPFKVLGGDEEQNVRTNSQGCLIWTETIAFNFLADEKYLPMSRTIVATGAQSGARELKMAINPWKLNENSSAFKDLAHTSVPQEQLATPAQLDLSLKPSAAGSAVRAISIARLPIVNSPGVSVGNSPTRIFKVEILPAVQLTDVTGSSTSVAFQAAAGKLKVSAALVESLTSGGRESKSTLSSTSAPVPVAVEGGKLYATFSLPITRGSEASRFLMALKVEPVDAPLGLKAFEGLFAIGDLHAVTEEGVMSGELKASNADTDLATAFSFSSTVGQNRFASPSVGTGIGSSTSGGAVSNRTGLFKMSTIVPSWSGPVDEDVANHRTVMYSVRACFIDLSNGSRPAVNEPFTVTLSDGTSITAVASDKADKPGCIDWEDKIKHRYYASEKWTRVPVTVKHASGYEEKQEYVVAPWGAWSFTVDAGAKADFINQINSRPPEPSRLLADGVEFNTGLNLRDIYSYEVDDFLSMQIVKRVVVRIPLRVFRPSNIRDGANMVPELARTGKYLLKAAFVAPVRGVGAKVEEMLISPMRGLWRVVDVRGGEIRTEIDFAVNDVRLMNARSYLVFEVKIIDEDKLPHDDQYLTKKRNSAGFNPDSVIDLEAGAIMPTYVAPLFLKNEKDFGIPIPVGDLSLDLPTTDAINQIPARNAVASAVSAAIRPFTNMTVDKLYAQARRTMEEYRVRMDRERSIGLFARRANAEFVSIHNESAVIARDPLLRDNNQILPNGGNGVTGLLALLNKPLAQLGSQDFTRIYAGASGARPQITQQSLQDFVKGDRAFDKKLGAQLCGYFFSTMPRKKLNAIQMLGVERDHSGAWVDDCIRVIALKGPDEVFLRDRRVRAIEVERAAEKIRGRSMAFQTGVEINIGKSASRSWGYGVGLGSGGLTGELSKLGMLGRSSGKMMKVLTAAPAVSGISAEISTSWDHTTAIEQGAGFSSGTELTMEQTELRIKMKRSEACVVVRPRPEFVEGGAGLRMRMMKLAIGEQRAEELMSRGLMICNGFPAKAEVAERYYTFGYDQPAANALDPHAVENLPWLLSLRGQRDYATFLLIASASQATVADARRTEIDIGDMPLARLEESYKKYFAGKTLSVPGFVTSEPKIMRVRNTH